MLSGVKFLFTALVAVQALDAVLADFLGEAKAVLPACAVECFAAGFNQSICSPNNLACTCTNPPLNEYIALCVASTCTVKESLTTKNFTLTACQAPVRDRSNIVTCTAIAGVVITTVIVFLRVIQRISRIGGEFGIDDVFIIAATAIVVPGSVISVIVAKDGLGKDLWTVPFDNLTEILELLYFGAWLYLAALAFTRISILAFYLRIFVSKNFRLQTYVLMGLNTAHIITFALAFILQCSPVSYAWLRWDGEHTGSCIHANAMAWTAAGSNIALDLCTIILPLPQIAKLQLSWGKKLPLMLVFALGFFDTAISCMRITYIAKFANTQNITWDYVPLTYWSSIEAQVSVIIACLPSLRALVLHTFRGYQERSVKTKSYEYSDGSSKKANRVTISSNRTPISAPRPLDHRNSSDQWPLQDLDSSRSLPSDGIRVDRHFDVESRNGYQESSRSTFED